MAADKDKVFLRVKDTVLILGALTGLVAAVVGYIAQPVKLEARVATNEKWIADNKDISTRMAIYDERYSRIQSDMKEMKNKADEIYELLVRLDRRGSNARTDRSGR